MSLLITERAGMHISNLDWRRTKTCNTPEKQVTSVSESVFMSGLWEEAASEMGGQCHNAAVDSIMHSAGKTREEAASKMGCRGHDGAVNSIVRSTGLTREEAALELG
jgi:hypothetical protein